jgi:hypothetical protein
MTCTRDKFIASFDTISLPEGDQRRSDASDQSSTAEDRLETVRFHTDWTLTSQGKA